MKTILKFIKPTATFLVISAWPAAGQTQNAETWSGPTFFTNGAKRAIAQQTVNNSGTVLWGDGEEIALKEGAVFNNLADGVFRVTNNGSMVYDASSAFNNFGLFEQMTGDGTTFMGNFTNHGKVNLQSGTLSFAYDYVQKDGITTLAGGELCAWPNKISILGGVLQGQGKIDAGNWNPGLLNCGTIIPTGLLKIHDASFAQSSAGAITISLGGTNAGRDYGQISITRSAALDGTLNITLANGFLPRLGEKFQVITYGSHKGSFAAINSPQLAAALALQPTYSAKNLTLTIVEARLSSSSKQTAARTDAKRDAKAERDKMLSYQP